MSALTPSNDDRVALVARMEATAHGQDRAPGGPLLSLQVLRFVAAATVLVHHTSYDADILASRTGRPPLGLDALFDWTFGVHLFFVLSGFIMVTAERDFGQPGAGRRFMLRRVIRVVPLYWLLTTALLGGAVVVPGLLSNPAEGWPNVLGSYLFVPVLRAAGDSHPVLGQGWTLDYEMLFYLVFAGAMVLPRPAGLMAAAAVLLGLPICGALVAPQAAALRVWTDPLMLEFLFGGAVALVRERGLSLGPGVSLLLVMAGFAVALAASPPPGTLTEPGWAVEGGAATLVLAGLALGPPWRPTGPVLALSRLGDASYSLYLSHPFVIRPVREAWRMLLPDAPAPGYVAVACSAAIAVALLLHRLVERPVMEALRHWSHAGQAGRATRADVVAVR